MENRRLRGRMSQSSGALCELRWLSWAFHPNGPYGFRGCKATLNHALALVSACPYVSQHPRALSNTTELKKKRL